MCRIIVAFGNIDVAKILGSIALMAKDQNSRHEMNEKKGPGSLQHTDGWGIAYLDQKGKFVIKKSPKAIFEDPESKKTLDFKTNLLIAHVRKKSGSEISLKNTHPFKAKHSLLGECVFCHNGAIEDDIQFDQKYKPRGKTDSERLFYSILSDIKENKTEDQKEDKEGERHSHKIAATIRNNLQKYTKTKGSNIVLATKNKTFVAMRKNELPRYYGMVWAKGNDFLLISSEKLKTFPDIYWKSILPGEVITIQNGTTNFFISREKKNLLQKIIALIAK